MNFKLVKASQDEISIMSHLIQFYIYDFSEFVERDVKEDGLFEPYPGLRDYWQEENHKFPYFIKQEKTYLGFVLVRRIETTEKNYFSMAEFFVMKRYRKKGLGRSIAQQVFDLHKGHWVVYQRETNKPAQIFWNKVIAEYTKGQFKERLEDGKRIQEFET
jgi:predicted acetyltransferase